MKVKNLLYLLFFAIILSPCYANAQDQVVEEWVRTWVSLSAADLAVDSSGNAYITGRNNGDYQTAKYDTKGNQLWLKNYDYDGDWDVATSLAVDSSGNVYVTGSIGVYGTRAPDVMTIKYDPNGNELWSRRVDNGWDRSPIIKVDSSGNVYVAWSSGPDCCSTQALTVIKYDSEGNELWFRRNSNDIGIVQAITLDSSGNLYLTGVGYGAITVKYDANGNELWVRYYNNGKYLSPSAIAADSSGNVYITGESYGGIPWTWGYATIKYDTDGNELWATTYDKCVDSDAIRNRGLVVDSSGNVYIAGNCGNSNANLIKYDRNGNQLWINQYVHDNSSVPSLAIDIFDNVYLSVAWTNVITYKVDSEGHQQWTVNSPNTMPLMLNGNTVDLFGNVYIVGSNGNNNSTISKYSQGMVKANAGPDQAVECATPSGASVVLDGSGSSDTNGGVLTYTWTWVGGSATGVKPTVTLPLGTTAVTLSVSDGKSAASDIVNITVRDSASPLTSATGGGDNWYNTNVVMTFSASDSCSGIKDVRYIIDGSETAVSGSYASVAITTEGIHNVSYYSVDNAGNKETPKGMTVKIDKTPPTITGAATVPPNSYGWYNTDVVVHFTASDKLPGSGIDTVTPDTTISTEGAKQSVTGSASDKAGNSATTTVAGINIDKTPPAISIAAPLAQQYRISDIIAVGFTAGDSLSGVYKNTVYLDGLQYDPARPIDMLYLSLGTHTFKVGSVNYAGLTATASVAFEVTVDSGSMINLIARLYQMGAIDNAGVENSLIKKVEAAQSASPVAAQGILNAFVNEVIQNGNHISPFAADILKAAAGYMIGQL